MNNNYFDVLIFTISKLIEKRRTSTEEEQAQINKKLTKLYDIKFTMLAQMNKQ